MNQFQIHQKIEVLKISKLRIWIGILLGLVTTVAFYAVFYMTKESIRLFSVTRDFIILVNSDEEVRFYNFFFAALAAILGQSVCLQFWTDRSRRFKSNNKEKLTSISNDQRGLQWNFIFWFAKLGFVLYLSVSSFHGFWEMYSFYDIYQYIYCLILIVLFLQSWVTIRMVFKRDSLKWMMVSFLMVCLIALGLSQINLIDYKAINNKILNMNVGNKNNIELPRVNYSIKNHQRFEYCNIEIYAAQNDSSTKPLIFIDSKKVDLDSLGAAIDFFRLNTICSKVYRNNYQLHIDKDLSMKSVNEIFEQIKQLDIHRFTLCYTIIPATIENEITYSRNYVINHSLSNFPEIKLNNEKGNIDIKILDSTTLLVDGQNININSFGSLIKSKIEQGQMKYLNLIYNDETKYEFYIKTLSEIQANIDLVVNNAAKVSYGKAYEDLTKKEKITIRSLYQLSIIDSLEVLRHPSFDEK